MVSFWPWKGEDNSPASFEKTLSTLSTKISESISHLDVRRQHGRRFKALWTLYTTFAYLLYTIVLVLVIGWRDWGIAEYSAVTGGPVFIYVVRALGARFFEFRVAKTQTYLDGLYKQRDETIERLKAATKYNSTLQLLEKYGGDSPGSGSGGKSSSRQKMGERKDSSVRQRGGGKGGQQGKQQQQQQQQQQAVFRTGLPPPPTANIRRAPPTQESPNTPYPYPYPYSEPQQFPPNLPPQQQQQQQQSQQNIPGFAPNAYSVPSQQPEPSSHWYDRFLDVLLGEDETQPKNRLVLLCANCRLVNGQAPPGVKTADELGRWRCYSCGAWNGEESEANRVLANIKSRTQTRDGTQSRVGDAAWEPVSGSNASSAEDVTDEGGVVVAGTATSEEEDGDLSRDQTESRSLSGDDGLQGEETEGSKVESVEQEEPEPEPEPELEPNPEEIEGQSESEPEPVQPPKRGRGRPKGSKNKKSY